ncbi:MAG: aminotransferase class I/II-fold pyridoxal phosphate-dependent enzyme [Candidatus Obscuribacterales bacterium]
MIVSENRSTRVRVEGRECLYFGGTNYLGLAHRPEIIAAMNQAFATYGLSSGASRLTSGETELLIALESELADFASCESALVLGAGFMTNQAVVEALDDDVDGWLVSNLAHGSIKTALSQSLKPVTLYEAGREAEAREAIPGDLRLGVFVEPIEPLTGSLTDLDALVKTLSPADILILDEAHSLGVLGADGQGAVGCFDRGAGELIRTGTLSKAFGCYGGIILASERFISRVKTLSPCYKSSTSLPPPLCAAARQALLLVRDKTTTVTPLQANIRSLNSRLAGLGIETHKNNSVPIYYLEDSPSVARMREDLLGKGIYIPLVTSYFADYCHIGLRWTIQAGHSEADLDFLVSQLII